MKTTQFAETYCALELPASCESSSSTPAWGPANTTTERCSGNGTKWRTGKVLLIMVIEAIISVERNSLAIASRKCGAEPFEKLFGKCLILLRYIQLQKKLIMKTGHPVFCNIVDFPILFVLCGAWPRGWPVLEKHLSIPEAKAQKCAAVRPKTEEQKPRGRSRRSSFTITPANSDEVRPKKPPIVRESSRIN